MTAVLAVKRSHADRSDGAGWALTAEGASATTALLRFSLTDRTGLLGAGVTSAPVAIGGWFHVAGVLDSAGNPSLCS